MESTKSSLAPAGKSLHSSITSLAHRLSGAQTIPDENKSETAFTRLILSCPLPGVNSETGTPMRRNS